MQHKLVLISHGKQSTHLLGGIDNASVVAKLQGAKHCPSHGQHKGAGQLLQRKNTLLQAALGRVTIGQSLGWQVLLFRYLA